MRKILGILIFAAILLVILLGLTALSGSGWGLAATNPFAEATSIAQAWPETPAGPPAALATPLTVESERHSITGRVISLDGEPVSGARIFSSDADTMSNADGWFQLPAGRVSQWITVEHPSFISRTRAAAPDSSVLVRLTPDDGETISLHFVGDTMFGRRFYDPNEDGNPNDGLLPIGAGTQEHLALLSGVRPLLQNADLTVLNLESSLSDSPYIDPTGPRPASFHPTKDYIFATHTSAAAALREAGVDVIDLANNHVYDQLDAGITVTLDGLKRAGFQPGLGYFGAGLSEAQAWRPAVVTVRGQTIAFLGCTSITYPFVEGIPQKDAIGYFASDVEGKGGAARCQEDKVRASVADAASKYDAVVFMVHGGAEYERTPSDLVVQMTTTARQAGAALVIDHQPHVVGGFDWDGSSLVAWTLGNFVFDQTVWPTFESYLVAVDLRRGQVVHAYVEPLMIENYLPKGVTGELAEYVARGAAGRAIGPFVIEDGAMEVDVLGRAIRHDVTMPVDGGAGAGTVFRLSDGWWVSGFSGQGELRMGRDLLWVGSFEDEDVDEDYQEGALWDLQAPNKYVGPEYAYAGDAGVRIQRGARDEEEIVLAPSHRIPVQPDAEISVVGMIRASANANPSLLLSWYPETRGPSANRTVKPISIQSADVWQPFRFDVSAPANMVAVGLFLRLDPPAAGMATVDLDNIRIIQWAPTGSSFSPLYDHILVVGAGDVRLSKDQLPGGEMGTVPPELPVVAR